MESKSLPIFPIPIGLYNFGQDEHALNVRLITDILTEQSEDPEGQVRSNMGGWHSADYQETIHKDSFGRLSVIIESQEDKVQACLEVVDDYYELKRRFNNQ